MVVPMANYYLPVLFNNRFNHSEFIAFKSKILNQRDILDFILGLTAAFAHMHMNRLVLI